MKETFERFSEKQIALITLALTVLALVVGIALPEIRSMIGLDHTKKSDSIEQSQASVVPDLSAKDVEIPDTPTPPTSNKDLPRTEIKQDFSNSGAQTGEFVVFPGVTFKNSGFLKGKVIIEKGAKFINSGAIEGTVVNKGGTFTNTGYLSGPLKVE